jgi:hypothetical protein
MSRERSCVRATVAPAATTAPEAAAADVVIKSEKPVYALALRYLGGKKFWRRRLDSRLDIHSAIVSGVAYGSVIFLVSQVKELKRGDLSKVLGISTRKLRRHGGDPEKQMPTDLTSRAWLFCRELGQGDGSLRRKEEGGTLDVRAGYRPRWAAPR